MAIGYIRRERCVGCRQRHARGTPLVCHVRSGPSEGRRHREAGRKLTSQYEATARSLFKQLSYRCPADTLLRLRRGSEVLIKMPADGLENARE